MTKPQTRTISELSTTTFTAVYNGQLTTITALDIVNGAQGNHKGMTTLMFWLLLLLNNAIAASINEISGADKVNPAGTIPASALRSKHVIQVKHTSEEFLNDKIGDLEIPLYHDLTIITADGHGFTGFSTFDMDGKEVEISKDMNIRWNIGNAPLGTAFDHWYVKEGWRFWYDWMPISCSYEIPSTVSINGKVCTTQKFAVRGGVKFNLGVAEKFAIEAHTEITKEWKSDDCFEFRIIGKDKPLQWWSRSLWFYQKQNWRRMVKRCYGGGSCLHSFNGEGIDYKLEFPSKYTRHLKLAQDDSVDRNNCGLDLVSWRIFP